MESKNKFKLHLPALNADCNEDICLVAADIRQEITYVAQNKT